VKISWTGLNEVSSIQRYGKITINTKAPRNRNRRASSIRPPAFLTRNFTISLKSLIEYSPLTEPGLQQGHAENEHKDNP
jgi:hypothetical protein